MSYYFILKLCMSSSVWNIWGMGKAHIRFCWVNLKDREGEGQASWKKLDYIEENIKMDIQEIDWNVDWIWLRIDTIDGLF